MVIERLLELKTVFKTANVAIAVSTKQATGQAISEFIASWEVRG